MLNLFEMFYDKSTSYVKSTLRNPRKCKFLKCVMHQLLASNLCEVLGLSLQTYNYLR